MKKTWFFATMALVLGTSCSKEDGMGAIDDSSVERIQLGVGSAYDVSVNKNPMSRGIGAVGDVKDKNKWNGEQVYVYGINNSAAGDLKFAINGDLAQTPADAATGGLTWVNGSYYNYNGNDLYDFYGAHVDDAVVADNMKIGAGTDLAAAGFAVDVTINGSQDLMLAVPDKAADIQTAIDAGSSITVGDANKLYSAWSSRRKVVPNLKFSHLLTRLNFQAKCNNEVIPGTDPGAKDMIKITKIEVLDVFNKGKLQIIPTADKLQGFTPDSKDTEAKVNFEVMSKGAENKLEALKPVDIITKEYVAVGEDMLLYPENEYTIVIYTEQDKDKDGVIKDSEKGTYTTKIKPGDGKPFEAESLYNINISVYGIEVIDVNASLVAWKDAGEIGVDPDMPDPQP